MTPDMSLSKDYAYSSFFGIPMWIPNKVVAEFYINSSYIELSCTNSTPSNYSRGEVFINSAAECMKMQRGLWCASMANGSFWGTKPKSREWGIHINTFVIIWPNSPFPNARLGANGTDA
jgi:hypothetical protein